MRKRPKKKATKSDAVVRIADLVQTPNVYSAWHPDKVDPAPGSTARAQLADAERMFDSLDKDGDDTVAPAFIQLTRSSAAAGVGTSYSAARAVLEQFARGLRSTALLEFARGPLDVLRLQELWRRVQALNTSSKVHGGQQAEQLRWCREFRNETASRRQKARLEELEANGTRRAVADEKRALQNAVDLQERLLHELQGGAGRLQELRNQLRGDAESTVSVLQKLRQVSEASSATVSLEPLGRAMGLTAAGRAELQDIVGATVLALEKAERVQTTALTQLHAQLSAGAATTAARTDAKSHVSASGDQNGNLEERYRKMCDWALGARSNQERQEESEKRAIHDALTVITSN
jgi:hypothetical protein